MTFDKHSKAPIFTPDGKRIFYSTNASGTQEIWSKAADGSGDATKLLRSDFSPEPLSISPDGNTLAYLELHNDTQYDIYFASLHGEPMPHPFLNGKASEGQARFSPDGRFIAYVSNESGETEVYVRSLQAGGGVWQVSNVDSHWPEWSKDGKKLYFVSEGSKLMVADVSSAGATFATGTPRRLFESIDFNHGGYAIAPDGRILFGLPTASSPRLNVLRVIEHFDTQMMRSPATSQSQ